MSRTAVTATTPATAETAAAAIAVVCSGCGASAPATTAFPARCPRAVPGDDIDHVMTCRIDPTRVTLAADDDPNPFVRYRQMFRAWHVAQAEGWSDERYVSLVHRLDRAVAAVDGHGFRLTPFGRADALSATLGFTADDGVWVKDETDNVSGSHKARHLMGIMIELLVAETRDPTLEGRPLAIASCGNAALAAAVVAHAAGRRLDVFVPPDADTAILERLEHLHARIELVGRAEGEVGDPTVRRMHAAIDAGAIPFTCQGPDVGLAIEGAATLGFEIAEAMARDALTLHRLVIQVGGGALASATALGLAGARALGVIGDVPRIDTVQTVGAWPLRRAFDRVTADLEARGIDVDHPLDVGSPPVRAVLDHAVRHRSDYMWPWETEPHSLAHGIIDDETYDWLAVVEAMLATGGRPLVVEEKDLAAADELAKRTTAIPVDATGAAGLAGLLHLKRHGGIARTERVALLFTGARRPHPAEAAGTAAEPQPDRSTQR